MWMDKKATLNLCRSISLALSVVKMMSRWAVNLFLEIYSETSFKEQKYEVWCLTEEFVSGEKL